MKKNISKIYLMCAVMVCAVALPLTVPELVGAAPVDVINQSCSQAGAATSELCQQNTTKLFGPGSFWTRIINAMLFLIVALGVVMITIGGFRYVVSGGDQGAITSAKNTILYSVIGIVVAMAAYAIVNFVLSAVV